MSKFNKILMLDYETRWARSSCDWAPDGYTLSKMTTEEYIRSPLFCAFGIGYKWYGEEGRAIWIRGKDIQSFFDSIDWSTTAVCAHNAMFDVGILTWIYGKKPAFIFDTLSMARALRGIEVGNSAARLAEEFGLPEKGRAIHSTDGLWELPFEVELELAEYCKHDVFLCEEFLNRLLPGYPKSELRLIDATIRMFTEPQLALDSHLLAGAITDDELARSSLLGRLGVTDEQLASNDKFAELLRALGVEPPTKISKTTKEETYAFAKNDALFQALINGDNEDVVLLCEARLKVKSTQERTRAQRFLDIAGRADGLLPVPVNYAHTRTLRWGAAKGSNINMQNLKRGGKLRKAVVAQAAHYVVAGDLSQIEPRVLAYLADYTELLEIFASGKDAYAQFGAQMFGIPGLNKQENPDLRQSAKSALLGCFGAEVKVLTMRGTKRIVDVAEEDLLWDGVEWVAHTGVVYQGRKVTHEFAGIAATDDHIVFTKFGEKPWGYVRKHPHAFESALQYGNVDATTIENCKYPEFEKPTATSMPGLLDVFSTRFQKTYDISNAGPRNRYTILSEDGPIIVHNCGYQLGWASFAAQLLTGFLGAPPVRYDKKFMKQLGIGQAEVAKFLEGKWGEENYKRMLEIPHTCTELELLTHCVCAKEIIDRYRAASEPIVKFWKFLEEMIATVLAIPGAEPVQHKCLTFEPGRIRLPNGLYMTYDKIKCETDEKGRPRYSYWNGKTYKNLYAGVVCENVTSGTARCVIGDGMLRVQPRYRCAMPVHDEGVWHVKEEEVEEATKWIKEQLIAPVPYLPGIPLGAEVGYARRYGNAK